MTRDLARALAEGLLDAGVTTIFGMPGGGPNLDMITSAQECGIDFVLAHSETAACMMAATHGRVTGGVGVAIVTRGPGLTNAVNGLAQATLDRYPLLLISDAVPAAQADRVAHQRLDQVAVAEPVTKWSGVLGAAQPRAAVTAAIALASTAPRGAVHLTFDSTQEGSVPVAPPANVPSSAEALADARALVASAARPLIIVGVDCIEEASAVRDVLASVQVPILLTYEAAGVVPASWPTYAGFFTGVAADRALLSEADLIIGIGLDPVEPMPGPWGDAVATLLLHSHAAETTYFTGATSVTGEYSVLLPETLGALSTQWRPPASIPVMDAALMALPSKSTLRPQDVVDVVRKACPTAIATVDAGAHMLVAMPLWRCEEPNTLLISNGLATMGFGLPAAIGAAVAHPERRVVCFTGDGGLGMVLSELEVLARLRLNLTVVVFNDATLTLIKLKQAADQQGETTVGYELTDFAKVGEAMGIAGRIVRTPQELSAAVHELDGQPGIIDCRVDAADYVAIIATARG